MEPIIILTGTQLQAFMAYMQQALQNDSNGFPLHTLRVAIDEGGVKLKFNGHSWSRALGEVDHR